MLGAARSAPEGFAPMQERRVKFMQRGCASHPQAWAAEIRDGVPIWPSFLCGTFHALMKGMLAQMHGGRHLVFLVLLSGLRFERGPDHCTRQG